jgi:hypothetical protein
MRPLIYISRPAIFINRISRLPRAHTHIRSLASQPIQKAPKMKRKQAPSSDKSPAKKAKPDIPEYHATPPIKEEDGSIQWPAPRDQIENARKIILEW